MTDTVDDLAWFTAVADSLRTLSLRKDIVVREIPAPAGLAPYAIALAADVRPNEDGESIYGMGRCVLLFDPAAPGGWNGPWRFVTFAQAPLETEIGIDPLLAEVAWSWLIDALDAAGAEYQSEAGTATKTLSRGFGALVDEGTGAQIELRASWSPQEPFAPHIHAWVELVGMLAGLPPGSEDVAVFGARRSVRG